MVNAPSLLLEMESLLQQKLPDRWGAARQSVVGDLPAQERTTSLAAWLNEVYLDAGSDADPFSSSDLNAICSIISRMLRLEPAERASASEILQDPWFHQDSGYSTSTASHVPSALQRYIAWLWR